MSLPFHPSTLISNLINPFIELHSGHLQSEASARAIVCLHRNPCFPASTLLRESLSNFPKNVQVYACDLLRPSQIVSSLPSANPSYSQHTKLLAEPRRPSLPLKPRTSEITPTEYNTILRIGDASRELEEGPEVYFQEGQDQDGLHPKRQPPPEEPNQGSPRTPISLLLPCNLSNQFRTNIGLIYRPISTKVDEIGAQRGQRKPKPKP